VDAASPFAQGLGDPPTLTLALFICERKQKEDSSVYRDREARAMRVIPGFGYDADDLAPI
jgi:hypothetical protein